VLRSAFGGELIGTYGDISVFSWRKFLPLHDGGTLVINRPVKFSMSWDKENLLSNFKSAKNLVEETARYGRSLPLKALDGLLRGANLVRDVARRKFASGTGSPNLRSEYLEFDPAVVNLPMSRVSRWIARSSDLSAVISKRRENYFYLHRALSSMEGIQIPFSDLPVDSAPWVFPVFFEGIQEAHLALRARGIPAVTWGGVRHPSIPRDAFPDSEFLYENLVLLPVHQDLRLPDLRYMVEESCSLLRTNRIGENGNTYSAGIDPQVQKR
jgi:dTDP-4-amino-4,6-dideoxygalactose transaminase